MSRWPGWAVGGGIAAIVAGSLAYGGYTLTQRVGLTVTSSSQPCVNQPAKLASLFSDGETTMIRLSDPDYTNMRILRTEPSNVLPGMFDALLSLSGDNSRLAYVTASNELMDDAHIESIDVADPSARTELATIPSGFWVVRPAWSPDNKKLAFVKLDTTVGPTGQFQLWTADTRTQPATLALQSDLVADNFTNGRSASLCWTKDNRLVLLPSSPLAPPSPASASGGASPTAASSTTTGSPCGVPVFSQNDPTWRAAVMQSGTDSIGGAGCALTSAAMLLNYYGAFLNPAELNACLGGSADPIDWTSVPSCTHGLINGGDRIDFTWNDLDALLAAGRPAIVGMLRGQTGSHFVVVTSGGGGLAENYRITDPWDATTYKTLGSYINTGYNPRWIISYSGPGHNCARLVKHGTPFVNGFPDGKITKDAVTLNVSNLKNLKFLGILQLSNGSIPKAVVNQPLNFTKLTPGTTVNDEGIYQVLAISQTSSQSPQVQLYRFTIDRTPPSVDLALLNPRASGAAAGQLAQGVAPTAGAASSNPVLDNPGKIRILSADTLSGVAEIKYSLDGGAQVEYSSDTTFNRVIVVSQSGDHSMVVQAFDAAGNMREVTKYFTVFGPQQTPPATPTPTRSTPPPPPPTCPTTLVLRNFSTEPPSNRTIQVFVYAVNGCPPFSATITATLCTPGQLIPLCQKSPYHIYSVKIVQACSGGSCNDTGNVTDTEPCPPGSGYYIVYRLTMKDAFGQTITASYGGPTLTPDPPC